MKRSGSIIRRLTAAIITFSCASSVDARSTFFLKERAEKCTTMAVISNTDLHLKYFSPDLDPKNPTSLGLDHRHDHHRQHLSTINISVKEHITSPDPQTPPRFLSSNKITSGEGKITVGIDFHGSVDICFSSPDPQPRLVGFSVTHSSHDIAKDKAVPPSPPKDNIGYMRNELTNAKNIIQRQIIVVQEMLELGSDLEEQEVEVWEALDGAYSILSWNPFIKIPIVLAMASIQAKFIISHLKKKLII